MVIYKGHSIAIFRLSNTSYEVVVDGTKIFESAITQSRALLKAKKYIDNLMDPKIPPTPEEREMYGMQ